MNEKQFLPSSLSSPSCCEAPPTHTHQALLSPTRLWGFAYLAHGAIFKASWRLMQKPAPPVANQNCTSLWEERWGGPRGRVRLGVGATAGPPLTPNHMA